MRYAASEKAEIIQLVEQSPIPVKRTLARNQVRLTEARTVRGTQKRGYLPSCGQCRNRHTKINGVKRADLYNPQMRAIWWQNQINGALQSRTYATLLEALNRHRGKGQQKVTVEHVHVHSGGQAVVGMVETPGGGDSFEIGGTTPCTANCICT
jgi:hypothetical protein